MFRAALFVSILLTGCGFQNVRHGPVSGGLVAKLNAQAITPEKGNRMVAGGKIATRSAPPGRSLRVRMQLDHAGLPHVGGLFNGRHDELMLDTGATVTVLDAGFAVRNRIATVPDVHPEMFGVMGKESGMGGIIESLQIDRWSVANLPCVIRLQRSSSGFGFTKDDFAISVLGFHLFQKHCSYLTLDYPARMVEFGFSGSFAGPTRRHSAKSTFRMVHGVPMARVSAGKASWEAIVDTGSCFGIEIDQKLAQRLGQGTGGTKVEGDFLMVGVGGVVTPKEAGVRVITVPRVSTLGSSFQNAQLDVMPGPARIGSFFLKDYRVTFDFRRQLIWLEW
ncbi:MAG: aspartyl protease family protein [Verrucomicrobiaceae bacterium]|nr:aspartyl protease family protein [Verrucomicrobiaceae bacterium]